MLSILHQFLKSTIEAELDRYKEITLQLELALYLRQNRPDLRVYPEQPKRNSRNRPHGGKKEIDISIYDAAGEGVAAIELKMPCSGRVPESMFDYCRDIEFCESLVGDGFRSAYAVILTNNQHFRKGPTVTGIYRHFRANETIHGCIQKPTGGKRLEVMIQGSYPIEWRSLHQKYIYAVTKIRPPRQNDGFTSRPGHAGTREQADRAHARPKRREAAPPHC